MALSRLQQFILRTAYATRAPRIDRREFLKFYSGATTSRQEAQGIVTKSLERLVDREFLVGYGRRTPHKWFIVEVRLTARGRRQAKRLLGEQQALPFRRRRKG